MPHSSAAFLLGSGASANPESALLLDTNIQVRLGGCPGASVPVWGRINVHCVSRVSVTRAHFQRGCIARRLRH